MFYDRLDIFDTLRFDDIFPGPAEFEEKMSAFIDYDLGSFLPFEELYYVLALRFAGAHTRYTSEFPFIMALIRNLKVVWPIYKAQKALMQEAINEELDEVMKTGISIRNTIERPTVGIPTEPSETPIPNLSSNQETVVNKMNKIDAIQYKYQAIENDYLEKVYKAVNKLFRIIAPDTTKYIYF